MKMKQVVIALLLVIIVLYVHFSDLSSWLTFEYLKAQSDALRTYASHHYLFSPFLFVLLYSVAVAVSLPTAFVLTIVGGFLFGTFQGALYSTISSTLGGLGAFFMVRYVFGNWVQSRYAQYLESFNISANQYGSYALLLMHLMPFIPYFLINIVAGISKIHWITFTWTTFLGVFPIALVYAFAGKELSELRSARDIFSGDVILALTLIACASIIPFVVINLYQRYYMKQR